MSTRVILHPNAGSAEQAAALRDALAYCPNLTLCETSGPGHATALAAAALQARCDLIVAAGGDGTINEVVNGLAANAEVAARFVAGAFLASEHVLHRRIRRLRLYSRPRMWFNADGELLTKEPVTFAVQPQALRVVVGPAYTPSPPQG